jgi:hypothetical protein
VCGVIYFEPKLCFHRDVVSKRPYAGTLHDVTHLPCRSARYTPAADASQPGGTPAHVKAGARLHAAH